MEGQTISDVDFVLPPPSLIRGQVVDAQGQPVAGVGILGHPDYSGQTYTEHFKVKTDAAGNFELTLKRSTFDNVWCVLACDPERGLAGRTTLPAGPPSTDPVEIKVSRGGYVTVTIVDTEGNPVPEVPTLISISPGETGGSYAFAAGCTDEEGKVRVGPLPAGHTVSLMPAGRFFNLATKFSRERVFITPGGEHRLAPIVLNLAGRSLTGWIGDEEQRPVKGALVCASGLDEPVHSDDQGRFELTGLPALGKLWIVAIHPTEPLCAAKNIDPDWGFTPGMILQPPGSATGRLVNEKEQPIQGARLRGYPRFSITSAGEEGWESGGFSSWQDDLWRRLGQQEFFLRPVTDAEGKWHVEGLIGGALYVFSVELPDGTSARKRYQFIAEPDATVDAGEIAVGE